jgi:hypothetical protein
VIEPPVADPLVVVVLAGGLQFAQVMLPSSLLVATGTAPLAGPSESWANRQSEATAAARRPHIVFLMFVAPLVRYTGVAVILTGAGDNGVRRKDTRMGANGDDDFAVIRARYDGRWWKHDVSVAVSDCHRNAGFNFSSRRSIPLSV